jgi:hypothetical protein
MTITDQTADVRLEELEICRSAAREAKVYSSYEFWPRTELFPVGRQTPGTLSDAVDAFLESKTGKLVVMFQWTLCEEFGQDEIEFHRSVHMTATDKFMHQTIENSVIQKIAGSLYGRLYGGVVSV